MLSPHEIAALLLLGDTQEIDDLEPEQLAPCWFTSWLSWSMVMLPAMPTPA